MKGEEFDDVLDGLPLSKRNKILRLVGDEERAPPKKPPKREVSFTRVVTFTFAILIGAPVCMLGLLMTLTVLLAPIGIPLMILGAMPLVKVIQNRVNESVAQKYTDSK